MLLTPVTRWLLVKMYPPSSIMTPEPEPDWVCEGLAGTPRVRIVTTDERIFATTAGTERFFSLDVALPLAAPQAEPEARDAIRLVIHRTRQVALGGGINSEAFSHNSTPRKSHAQKTTG
jgi:phospholipid N-methyltransferase